MAKEVDIDHDGFVIELGGGTGTITEALLKQGVSPDKLITIERSPKLAAYLRQKFPDIHVIEGDAGQLIKLLGNGVKKINSIVSGLPFKSLPESTVFAIKQQIKTLLKNGGKLIQFTYDLSLSSLSCDTAFSMKSSKVEWRNLPPARINTMALSVSGLSAQA
jgi:phospholipid N-methyltransferase